MNANRLINMAINMIIRRVMRTGMDAGIKAFQNRNGRDGQDMQGQNQPPIQSRQAAQNSRQMRKAMKMGKRMGRF